MKKIVIFTILSLALTGCVAQKMDGGDQKSESDSNISDEIKEIKDENLSDLDNNKEVVEIGNNNIKVYNIKDGDTISSPVIIQGEAIALENKVVVEIRNSEHKVIIKDGKPEITEE